MATQSAIPVLVTRPEPQASRFAAALGDRLGTLVRPVVSPLMQTRFPDVDLPPGPFAFLLLTSEAGARAAGRMRDHLPQRALCVGDSTARAAREEGFASTSAGADSAGLARLIAGQTEPGPLLYLHGKDRAADLAALVGPGRNVVSLAVYDQQATPLSAVAETVLRTDGPVIVPLFSPRSTRLFLAVRPPAARARLAFAAISAAAADPLPAELKASAVIAERPDSPAMLAAISRLLAQGLP